MRARERIRQQQQSYNQAHRSIYSKVSCDDCIRNLPSSLSFYEALHESIKPEEIVIFSGGDSYERRTSGFGKISSEALIALAEHHGYSLVFLDQLDYDRNLVLNGIQFAGHWHRVFAMEALRKRYPNAKYYVWLDDDILAPYPETSMLNHYINMVQSNPSWELLYGEEGGGYVLNSGMFIMRNSQLAFEIYKKAKQVGLENNGYLAQNFGHEQGAIVEIRRRFKIEHIIPVIRHRNGPYNFNTFARKTDWDMSELASCYGDAFVHFLGHTHDERLTKMTAVMKTVADWRKTVPVDCVYPIGFRL